MASITLGGHPAETIGNLPSIGAQAPDFKMTASDMSSKSLSDYAGKRKLLNIFPSVDTGVCSASARRFNADAAGLENTVVLCVSRDLPFAQARFCAAEGIENVEMLTDYKDHRFGKDYEVEMISSAFKGLLSRAIVVLDENNQVIYTQQVPEIGQEPDYKSALDVLS